MGRNLKRKHLRLEWCDMLALACKTNHTPRSIHLVFIGQCQVCGIWICVRGGHRKDRVHIGRFFPLISDPAAAECLQGRLWNNDSAQLLSKTHWLQIRCRAILVNNKIINKIQIIMKEKFWGSIKPIFYFHLSCIVDYTLHIPTLKYGDRNII